MSQNIVGQTLLNQFRVDSFVASGGMGVVYRVWDLKRNVPLAMKVLHTDLAEDPSIFKRFKREANALKKLAHPNIVPFYGLYQSQDIIFLLERFIEGPSLKEILYQRRDDPLPVSEAISYLGALCAALGYSHTNGVIHCDVKPGNIMVDRGGNIYLTDFGIARHAESTTTTLGMAGTPAYMAPEQILGKMVTPETDIYSLGVILFEMLTGKRPFRGDESGTEKSGSTANERIRYAHLNLTPPNPRSINGSLSNELSETILKALNKEPDMRYHSALEFLSAVYEAARVEDENINNQTNLPKKSPPPIQSIDIPEVSRPPVKQSSVQTSTRGFGFLGFFLFSGLIILIATFAVVSFTGNGNLLAKLIPTQTPLPTLTSVPTQTPFPSQTPLPTYTLYPTVRPTLTRRPPSPTPIKVPTRTPKPSRPTLYLDHDSYCRYGPSTSEGDLTGFFAGERFPIIGWSPDAPGWWLVEVNVPYSRYKSCWIYGNTPEGDYSSVPEVNP